VWRSAATGREEACLWSAVFGNEVVSGLGRG
jgi:hypothetical protein